MKIERNYGVDLLRIVAMYMVVVLHVLGKGGILYSLPKLSISYGTAWFLEIAAYCAVNCYALISGYVGVRGRFRLSSIMSLWLQVVFYTVGITLLFCAFQPEVVEFEHIMRAFMPATYKQYWYFTAYLIVFFVSPFINAGFNMLKKRDIKILLILMTICFSFIATFVSNDYFMLNDGYSALWLIYLYILGGYIAKYGLFPHASKIKLFFVYLLSVLLTWASLYVFEYCSIPFINGYRILVNYLSPTILISAVSLLLLFSRLDVKGIMKKVVIIFSPATFGVYLIHTQPLFWSYLWTDSFKSYIDFPFYKLAVYVLLTSAVVYIVLSVIDMLRTKLFEFLKVKHRVLNVESKLLECLDKS